MPVYLLKCGGCLKDSNVSATDQPIYWVCDDCGNENSTSLPITPVGDLVTDATKADAILTPTEANNAKQVIESVVIDETAPINETVTTEEVTTDGN